MSTSSSDPAANPPRPVHPDPADEGMTVFNEDRSKIWCAMCHSLYAGTEICVDGELTDLAAECDVCGEAVVVWSCDTCYQLDQSHTICEDGPVYPQLTCGYCGNTEAQIQQENRQSRIRDLENDVGQVADKYGIPDDEARAVHMGAKEEWAIRSALEMPPRIAKPDSLVARPGTLLGEPIVGSGCDRRDPVWNGLLPPLREKAKLLFLINLRHDPALPIEVLRMIIALFECPAVPTLYEDIMGWRRMYNDYVRNGAEDQDRPVPLGAGRCIHVDTVRENYEDCNGKWPTHPAPFWCAHDGMLDYAAYRVFLWRVRTVRYPGSTAAGGMPLDHCPTHWKENPEEWFASDMYKRFRASRARTVYHRGYYGV